MADTEDDEHGASPGSAGVVPVVRARGVAVSSFGHQVLRGVDLVIQPGEHVALVGPNGSGKTTFLRVLAGALGPAAGDVEVGGVPFDAPAARAVLSAVADDPVFYEDLSLWEHLEYVARLHGTEHWEEHAAHLVDAFGLGSRVDDPPATFSRGLRQRAQLALAFVRPFDVLALDDPTAGLDGVGRAALADLVSWANDDGAAIVTASYEPSIVAAARRVVALRDGVVVFDGPMADADLDALTAPSPPPDER